jgi:hypothetical protein
MAEPCSQLDYVCGARACVCLLSIQEVRHNGTGSQRLPIDRPTTMRTRSRPISSQAKGPYRAWHDGAW